MKLNYEYNNKSEEGRYTIIGTGSKMERVTGSKMERVTGSKMERGTGSKMERGTGSKMEWVTGSKMGTGRGLLKFLIAVVFNLSLTFRILK